jgi:hypothetical protein
MVQLSATRCSYFVSHSSEFCRYNLFDASQLVFIVVYFVIDLVRKLLDNRRTYSTSVCKQGKVRVKVKLSLCFN